MNRYKNQSLIHRSPHKPVPFVITFIQNVYELRKSTQLFYNLPRIFHFVPKRVFLNIYWYFEAKSRQGASY